MKKQDMIEYIKNNAGRFHIAKDGRIFYVKYKGEIFFSDACYNEYAWTDDLPTEEAINTILERIKEYNEKIRKN